LISSPILIENTASPATSARGTEASSCGFIGGELLNPDLHQKRLEIFLASKLKQFSLKILSNSNGRENAYCVTGYLKNAHSSWSLPFGLEGF